MTTSIELSTHNRKISDLKNCVHSTLDYNQYNSTNIINSTNCYSHAIGSTLPYLQIYRIGAICGKKDIFQNYFSIEEIVSLLIDDLHSIDLKIEKSFLGDSMNLNQYQIAIFVKIYADNKIHDYHFLRNDSLGWSEKWRGQKVIMLDSFENRNYFPWNFIGIFKITK